MSNRVLIWDINILFINRNTFCVNIEIPSLGYHAWLPPSCGYHVWFPPSCGYHVWFPPSCGYHVWFPLSCGYHARLPPFRGFHSRGYQACKQHCLHSAISLEILTFSLNPV